jgi:hypothetical protein
MNPQGTQFGAKKLSEGTITGSVINVKMFLTVQYSDVSFLHTLAGPVNRSLMAASVLFSHSMTIIGSAIQHLTFPEYPGNKGVT